MIFKTVGLIFFCGLAISFEIVNLAENVNKQNVTLGTSDKQFIVSSETVNFFRAILSCKQAGMELASITNKQEQENLEYVLRDVNITGGAATGLWLAGTNLVDRSSNQYYWLMEGKAALYTNWCPGEPNNVNGSENCLQIVDRGSNHICWNDLACEHALRYVCQY